MSLSVEQRFWAKVQKTDTCWLWTASGHQLGYGHFWANGRKHQAHRFAYELEHGPVPRQLDMDHLCRNPRCVNPSHLEPVTHRENMLRGARERYGANRHKTHCDHGHEFTPENTRLINGGPKRVCRACQREACRRYNLKRRPNSRATLNRSKGS